MCAGDKRAGLTSVKVMRAGVGLYTAGFERSRAIEYCAVYVRVYYGVWKIEKNAS